MEVETCPVPIYCMLSQGFFICSVEFKVRGTGDGVEIVAWDFPEPMGMIAQEKKVRECVLTWTIPKNQVLDFTWTFNYLGHGYLQWCNQKGQCTKMNLKTPLFLTDDPLPAELREKFKVEK